MRSLRMLLLAVTAMIGVARADNIAMGVETTEYYPFYHLDGGNYAGFAREVLDAFAAKYHHTLSYKPLDIPPLLTAMLNGEVDLKFPDDAHWAADKRAGKTIYYSKPLIDVYEGLMVQSANVGKGLDSIKTIGTVRGFSPFVYLDQVKSGKIKVIEAQSFSALVKIGSMKEVDGIYISPTIGDYQLEHTFHNPGLLKFDKSLPNATSHFGVSSTKRQDLVKQFDEFLEQEKPAIDALRTKYHISH